MQSRPDKEQNTSLLYLYNSLKGRIYRLSSRSSPADWDEANQQWQFFLQRLAADLGGDFSAIVGSLQLTITYEKWREDFLIVLDYLYEITDDLTQGISEPVAGRADLSSLQQEVETTATYSLIEIDRLAQRLLMAKKHVLSHQACGVELKHHAIKFRQIAKKSRCLFGQALEKSPEFLQGISLEAQSYFLFVLREIKKEPTSKGPLNALLWEQKRSQHPQQKYWCDWVEYLHAEGTRASSQASAIVTESMNNRLQLVQSFDTCNINNICRDYDLSLTDQCIPSTDLLHTYLIGSALFIELVTLINGASSIEGVCSGIQGIMAAVSQSAAKTHHYSDYPFLLLCQALNPSTIVRDGETLLVQTEGDDWGLNLCVLVLTSLPTTSYTFLQDCVSCFVSIATWVKEKKMSLPAGLHEAITQVKETLFLGSANVLTALTAVIDCLSSHLSPSKVAELQAYILHIKTFWQTVYPVIEQGDLLSVLEQYQAYLQLPESSLSLDSFLFSPLCEASEPLRKRLFTSEQKNSGFEDTSKFTGLVANLRELSFRLSESPSQALSGVIAHFEELVSWVMTNVLQQAALDIALVRGHLPVVKRLLLLEPGIIRLEEGLVRWIRLGSLEFIVFLYGVSKDSPSEHLAWVNGSKQGLVHAAKQGDIEKLQWFLDSGLVQDQAVFSKAAKEAACLGQVVSIDKLFFNLSSATIEDIFKQAINHMQPSVVQFLVITKQQIFHSELLLKALSTVCYCKDKAAVDRQAMLDCLFAASTHDMDPGTFDSTRQTECFAFAFAARDLLPLQYMLQSQKRTYSLPEYLSMLEIAYEQDALSFVQMVVENQPLILTQHLCSVSAVQKAHKAGSKRVLWFLLQDPYVQKEIIHSSSRDLVLTYRLFSSAVDEVWFKLLLLQEFTESLGFTRDILVEISTRYSEICGLGQSIAPRRPCYMRRPSASSPWMELVFKTRDEARTFITKNLSILWDGSAQPLLEEVHREDYRVKIVERSSNPRDIYKILRGYYPDFQWENRCIDSLALYKKARMSCPALQLEPGMAINNLFVDPTKEENTFTCLVLFNQEKPQEKTNKVTYGEFSFQVKLSRPAGCSNETFDLSQLTVEVINFSERQAVGLFALVRRLQPHLCLPAFEALQLEDASVRNKPSQHPFFIQNILPVVHAKPQRTDLYNRLEQHLWSLQRYRGQNSLPSVEETAVMKLLHFLDGVICVSFSAEDFAVFSLSDAIEGLEGISAIASILHDFPDVLTLLIESQPKLHSPSSLEL